MFELDFGLHWLSVVDYVDMYYVLFRRGAFRYGPYRVLVTIPDYILTSAENSDTENLAGPPVKASLPI
jgi:hypothetical protein